MSRPVAETGGDQIRQADRHIRPHPGHHVVDPKYDELFEVAWTPACDVLDELFGDYELSDEVVGTTLVKIGMSWLYIPPSEEFVKALAVVFALMHFANANRGARSDALAWERRQGRSLSSVYDVQFDAEQWLDDFLGAGFARQRRDLFAAVSPLTREDLAFLLEMNSHQVPRSAALLWRARAPEEET